MTEQAAILQAGFAMPASARARSRLATAALILAVVAAAASLICSVIVGLGPLEARQALGQERPEDMQLAVVYLGLGLSNILWRIIGVTGLVLGIVAAVRGAERRTAIITIVTAGAAPVPSFGVWLLLTLMTSPLGQGIGCGRRS